MNHLENTILALSDKIKKEIINDFEVFEKNGGTLLKGTLKNIAEKMFKEYPVRTVSAWAAAIANECYRYFALKYLESKHDL